jgi:hypothetical protein
MNPREFPEANTIFGPPPDLEESQCMRVAGYLGKVQGGSLDGSTIVVVCWQPTMEEIEAIKSGKPIFLSFLGGLPPHLPTLDFQEAIHPA